MTASLGECITYLWPGSTIKSMYRCYTERGIITMLEAPWSRTTSTSSRSSSSSSTTSRTSTSASAPAQSTTDSPPPASGGGGSNAGAIAGGVVGGIAGLAAIVGVIAYIMIRSRKTASTNTVGAGTAYSAVSPGDPGYPSPMPPTAYAPSSLSPQTTQAGYFAPSTVGTVPPIPGAYDQRQSYYDPAKPADQQQAAYMYAPYPGAQLYPGAYPGPYPPPQQHPVSELDGAAVLAGQQGNPIEMSAMPASQQLPTTPTTQQR